jgi:hypothetical protein
LKDQPVVQNTPEVIKARTGDLLLSEIGADQIHPLKDS